MPHKFMVFDNSKSLNDKIKTRENKDVEPKRDGDPGQQSQKRNNLANNHVAVAPCTYLLRKSLI